MPPSTRRPASRVSASRVSFRPVRPFPRSAHVPVSKLRVDCFLKLLSVQATQISAAKIPPTAPSRRERGDTCRRSIVVPTASTHQVRRPSIIN